VELSYQNGIMTTFVELSDVISQLAIISPTWPMSGFWDEKLGLILNFYDIAWHFI